MKRFIFCCLLTLSFCGTRASHISGGEMIYDYLGPGTVANSSRYRLTLKLFRDQFTTGAQMPANVTIGIFDNTNNSQYPSAGQVFNANINNGGGGQAVAVEPAPPCMSNPPAISYNVGLYSIVVDLPDNTAGYTAAYQTCCRINPLNNVVNQEQPAQGEGSTYACFISGVTTATADKHNSSPQFSTVLTRICRSNPFTFDFSATDLEGDSLVYYFCEAYNRGASTDSRNVNPTAPPYRPVIYTFAFSGVNPLGSGSSLNRQTGIISGIAPAQVGRYVVCVCIDEYRNGVKIGYHRKDFILTVSDCNIPDASLSPDNRTCDGFTRNFFNGGSNINVQSWFWDFGVPEINSDTSTLPNPIFTYPDTGTYTMKLVVNRGLLCADSSTVEIKVYPGFFPGFRAVPPFCKGVPVSFRDTTKTNYGTVSGWLWDFGNPAVQTDESILQNPSYTYPLAGDYDVTLVSTNSYGCIDTITNRITIQDSPDIGLTPHDTLICYIDTLQLTTTGTGSFQWSPNYNINNVNAAMPLVSPDVPTTYTVALTNAVGCTSRDSIFVNVKQAVSINAGADTTICRTDGVRINTVSDALSYTWTPPLYLDDSSAKSPFANPLDSVITYKVVGNIGNCQNQDFITIRTLPYPPANAGLDDTVCFRISTQLNATGGRTYQWSPATFLSSTTIPNPQVINPTVTTQYIVAVTDVVGCPKPKYDTVLVIVDSKVIPNAGPSDTTAVLGEPIHLQGTGGATYLWSPSTYLDNPNSANPIALPETDITYKVLVTSQFGCSDTDTIHIKLYTVPPSFYVPSAFTPNSDGKNDDIKPILLGMRTLEYFRVYNRLGQLVFSTSTKGAGWDGFFKGSPQDPGTFVWMAQGATYKNEIITQKGYVVLIR